MVYTNTDVEEVNVWMVKHFTEHPLFTRVPEDQLVGGTTEPPLHPLEQYNISGTTHDAVSFNTIVLTQ